MTVFYPALQARFAEKSGFASENKPKKIPTDGTNKSATRPPPTPCSSSAFAGHSLESWFKQGNFGFISGHWQRGVFPSELLRQLGARTLGLNLKTADERGKTQITSMD